MQGINLLSIFSTIILINQLLPIFVHIAKGILRCFSCCCREVLDPQAHNKKRGFGEVLWSLVGGWMSYTFLLPLYIGIMPIFAFTNLHDVSWGNRDTGGDVAAATEFKDQAFCWLAIWTIYNMFIFLGILGINTSEQLKTHSLGELRYTL